MSQFEPVRHPDTRPAWLQFVPDLEQLAVYAEVRQSVDEKVQAMLAWEAANPPPPGMKWEWHFETISDFDGNSIQIIPTPVLTTEGAPE